MTRNLFPGPDMHALRARPPEEEKAYGLIYANQIQHSSLYLHGQLDAWVTYSCVIVKCRLCFVEYFRGAFGD